MITKSFFAEQLTKAQFVVHISMAESVSPGFANALEASKAFDNVMVIDSGQLSSGMGLIVLYAISCLCRRNGSRGILCRNLRLKKQIQTSFYCKRDGISDAVQEKFRKRFINYVRHLCPSCSCFKKWQDENKENLCWQKKNGMEEIYYFHI